MQSDCPIENLSLKIVKDFPNLTALMNKQHAAGRVEYGVPISKWDTDFHTAIIEAGKELVDFVTYMCYAAAKAGNANDISAEHFGGLLEDTEFNLKALAEMGYAME